MNVTRDIVRDLLPAYLAGDASDDTRKAVEQFVREDEEIARLATEVRNRLPPPPAGRADADLVTLRRARRAVAARSWLLAGRFSSACSRRP